eukprot:scaffold21510_cov111-Isochrysis_galbana.AAC.2
MEKGMGKEWESRGGGRGSRGTDRTTGRQKDRILRSAQHRGRVPCTWCEGLEQRAVCHSESESEKRSKLWGCVRISENLCLSVSAAA